MGTYGRLLLGQTRAIIKNLAGANSYIVPQFKNQWSFASSHFKWQCITFESKASNAVDEGVAEVAKRTPPFAVFCTKYTPYAHRTFVKYFITNPNSIWTECFKLRLKRFL